MRARCPNCNSIQTKFISKISAETLFGTHKCKSCGERFFLNEVNQSASTKKSFLGGCLTSFFKIILLVLIVSLGIAIAFKFIDEDTNEESLDTEVIERPYSQTSEELSSDSIEYSNNASDTLSIKTTVRQKD